MSFRELLEKRAKAIEKARAVVEKADKENREMNEHEKRTYDLCFEEVKQLESEVKEEEARREEERQSAAAGGTVGIEEGIYSWRKNDKGQDVALRHSDSVRAYLEDKGNYDKDIASIRPGQILRAMVLGAKTDQEKRALGAGLDVSGGYTCPDILAARFIDAMRARSVMSRAGARTIPIEGETSFAMVTADPTPGWRPENASVEEDEPTFGKLTFKPKSLAVLCKVSREVLEDSLNIEDALVNSISKAMALELDRVCLIGIGAEQEPMGLIYWDNVHEVDLSNVPSYDSILEARTDILSSNSLEPTATIMHPRDEGYFTRLKDGQGLPYPIPPALKDMQFLTTTQIPITLGTGTDSLMITGDFKQAVIAIRTQLRIEVLKEAFADKLQYGFLAFMRADFAPEWDEAFAQITGVQAE